MAEFEPVDTGAKKSCGPVDLGADYESLRTAEPEEGLRPPFVMEKQANRRAPEGEAPQYRRLGSGEKYGKGT